VADDYEPAGFVENWDRGRTEGELRGMPIHWLDDAAAFAGTHHVICAIGTTRRQDLVDRASAMGFEFASVRHPSAVVAPSADVGAGTIIGAGVVVAARSTVGRHTILNRGVLVGHHTVIGECVTVSPGANVAGRVTVKDRAYIGMGAIILEDRVIGAGAIVGAGSVVTRDVDARQQVQGLPARVVRENAEPR
jgi:acetyltransferase EpsM